MCGEEDIEKEEQPEDGSRGQGGDEEEEEA